MVGVEGGIYVLTFAGKRDAADVANDCSTVRPGLVERKLQTMR
jgi:hypothetical protein